MTQSPFFALAFWFVLLPSLWATGTLAGFWLREKNSLFSGFVKLGLGLGVYAAFLTLAGTLCWLKPEAVLTFIGISLIFGWQRGMGVFDWLHELLRFFWEPSDALSRVCQLSLAGTLVFTGLFCFLPEISNDALAIQLYCAKLFAANASTAPSFYDLASYRPLLMSVLYSTGVMFHNVAVAKLFHWFCGVLLIGAVAVKIAETTGSKRLGLFSSLMLWLTPTMMNQITTTYIDAGVSIFIFLGFCVLVDGFDDWRPSRFIYGGLLIGFAVAIRSLALGAAFAVGLMLLLSLFRRGCKMRIIVSALCFALGILITSSYWFLRDWIYTGNPVYPYMGKLFGTDDLSLFSSIYFYGMGVPRSVASFLLILWDITFKPQFFDYHHWVGPIYLSVLPFTLYAAIRLKETRRPLLFVLFLTTFWYFTGQNVRYLLPALPVYLVAAARGLHESSAGSILRRRRGILMQATAIIFIAGMLSLTAYHFRYQFKPIFRMWSVDTYLRKMERTTPVAHMINQELPQRSKILVLDEVHLYLIDRDVVLDADFEVRTHYKRLTTSAAAVGVLKARGITHILDAKQMPASEDDARSANNSRPIDLFLKNPTSVRALKSIASENILGSRCEYTLYSVN